MHYSNSVQDKQTNQISFRQELYRKLTHLGALSIPVGYYIFRLSRAEALWIMIPITLGMIILDISRLKGWKFWNLFRPVIGPIIREHESRGDFTGASYILTSACLVIALFDKPIAMASLVFIIVGDTAAALIGRRFGRHKIGHKSIEGSLSFLIVSAVVVLIIPDLNIIVGLTGAVAATIAEAVTLRLDDNTTVPLISGLVMHLLNVILAS